MKNYLKLLFMAIFASMSFAFVACGDEDDEPENNVKYDLVGSWISVSETTIPGLTNE